MFENSYALFFVSSYFLGTCVFVFNASRHKRRMGEIIEVLIVVLTSSLFGAKIFHALFEAEGHPLPNGEVASGALELFMADPWHWAQLFSPGYVFYGGLASALAVSSLFLYKRRIKNPLQYADYSAPAIALGLALGRLGCYSAGCCFSEVVPVQLIESGFALLCFVWLIVREPKNEPDGSQLWLFVCTYAVFRFCIEFVRDDSDRGLWLWDTLSTSQVISLLLILGSFLYERTPRKHRENQPFEGKNSGVVG